MIQVRLRWFGLVMTALGVLGSSSALASDAKELELSLGKLRATVPLQAAAFEPDAIGALKSAAARVESLAALMAVGEPKASDARILADLAGLLAAKDKVDTLLLDALAIRGEFLALAPVEHQRQIIRSYLRALTQLIDLSGRLRYAQVDAFERAVSRLLSRPDTLRRMIDLATTHHSTVGAMALARVAFETRPDGRAAVRDGRTYSMLLELIQESNQTSLMPRLAEVLEGGDLSPAQIVATAETIRAIGLPQEPAPDPIEELPAPPLTAQSLLDVLAGIDPSSLSQPLAGRHAALLQWLRTRTSEGITENRFRVGNVDVEPGDWLLMRNPSPYNHFTELSPGLFTHVGVVTTMRGADGIQRMVVVDMPERGSRIPATNIETYVVRTLHYVFVRHPDPAVASQMAAAARAVIGNPAKFDLNFRTSRVLELAKQPLEEETVHTYCAGMLLLCALTTKSPREEFFPIREPPAGGRTLENLNVLGLSMDDDFISPTGALFSPVLRVVGGREPMYDPRREVEEAVFDHFAHLLKERVLVPAPDLYQSLRLKLAEASRTNPLLAEAMARAAGVSADLDLVSAAKAGAVIETLDEIAFGASGEFLEARELIMAGPIAGLAKQGFEPDEIALVKQIRQVHAELVTRFEQGRLSPRELRIELVRHYIESGQRELERRFFSAGK